MSTAMIFGWIFVALITGVNIFVFLKLKQASEQVMKMAFPKAKNLDEAVSQMGSMFGKMGMGGAGGPGAQGNPFAGMAQMSKSPEFQQQMKQAMQMLQQMQRKQ